MRSAQDLPGRAAGRDPADVIDLMMPERLSMAAVTADRPNLR